MAILTRDTILGATKPPQQVVNVPELGGEVIVRGMTGVERDAFEMSCFEGRGKKRDWNMRNMRAKLVGFCCIDEAGRRVFTDQDVEALGSVRADVIDRLFSVAQKLSGMKDEDVDELGLTSTTTKPLDTSSSASPSS